MRRNLAMLAIFACLATPVLAADILATSPDDTITLLPDADDLVKQGDGINVQVESGGTFILNNRDTDTTVVDPPVTTPTAVIIPVPTVIAGVTPEQVMASCGWNHHQSVLAIASLANLPTYYREQFILRWPDRDYWHYSTCGLLKGEY